MHSFVKTYIAPNQQKQKTSKNTPQKPGCIHTHLFILISSYSASPRVCSWVLSSSSLISRMPFTSTKHIFPASCSLDPHSSCLCGKNMFGIEGGSGSLNSKELSGQKITLVKYKI